MKLIKYIFIIPLFALFACNNVPKEILNTPLYNDVIKHYERIDNNNEKKKAALFLFKNMREKYSLFDSMTDSILTFISDSIEQEAVRPDSKEIITTLIRKSPKTTKPVITYDHSVIKSNGLISYIDITFNSWERLSTLSGASFDDYCEYILPYRVKNESVFQLSPRMFENEFSAFTDTLKSSDSIVPAISGFIQSLGCKLDLSLSNNYPLAFSPKQVFELKIAPRCDDFVIFLVSVLRSVGIPATMDYLPQWGNHYYFGHSWLAVKWQKKWYAFDAVNGKYLNNLYRNESIPKVFRQMYSISKKADRIDVTKEYGEVTDFRIKIKTGDKLKFRNMKPAVAVFNKFTGFKIMDFGRKNRTNLIFKDLGRRVIYFIGEVENKKFKPLINPVFIDSLGGITHLIPKWDSQKEYTLERKYPLTRGNSDRRKESWAKSISGSWIEASNDNFATTDTLIVFKNYNSYKEENFLVNSDKPYKEIRFRCGPKNQIATLKFFNREHNLLTGEIIHDLWKGFKPEKLFDNDMLSWVWIGNTHRYVYVGYKFNSPQYISSISVQTRNDGNHIVPGDKYELMVYDYGWKSLGIKIAEKQELNYSNVPSGGVYWLKNLSNGTEELPFMFDSNNNQYWAGQ